MHTPHLVPRSVRLMILVLILALMGSACSDSQDDSATVGSPNEVSYKVDFQNSSDRCTWVTLYHTGDSIIDPWHIITGTNAGPRYVRPGESHTFQGGDLVDSGLKRVRVRTEIMPSSNCSSTVAADLSDETATRDWSGTSTARSLCGTNGDY